jgi:hypothetical protein
MKGLLRVIIISSLLYSCSTYEIYRTDYSVELEDRIPLDSSYHEVPYFRYLEDLYFFEEIGAIEYLGTAALRNNPFKSKYCNEELAFNTIKKEAYTIEADFIHITYEIYPTNFKSPCYIFDVDLFKIKDSLFDIYDYENIRNSKLEEIDAFYNKEEENIDLNLGILANTEFSLYHSNDYSVFNDFDENNNSSDAGFSIAKFFSDTSPIAIRLKHTRTTAFSRQKLLKFADEEQPDEFFHFRSVITRFSAGLQYSSRNNRLIQFSVSPTIGIGYDNSKLRFKERIYDEEFDDYENNTLLRATTNTTFLMYDLDFRVQIMLNKRKSFDTNPNQTKFYFFIGFAYTGSFYETYKYSREEISDLIDNYNGNYEELTDVFYRFFNRTERTYGVHNVLNNTIGIIISL